MADMEDVHLAKYFPTPEDLALADEFMKIQLLPWIEHRLGDRTSLLTFYVMVLCPMLDYLASLIVHAAAAEHLDATTRGMGQAVMDELLNAVERQRQQQLHNDK